MRVLLLTAALLSALTAPVQAAPGKTHVVEVVGLEFKPKVVHAKVGDRIKWVFRGPGAQSVRRGLDPARPCKSINDPNSGPKRPGQTFIYELDRPRSFTYHSDVDANCYKGMMGEVHTD